MALKTIQTENKILFKFKKARPVNWNEFQEHLKSLGVNQFGSGEATTKQGGRRQAVGGMHRDGQILYIPDLNSIQVVGPVFEPFVKLSKEIGAILAEIYRSPERLKANISYYEIEIKEEVEPENALPLEIMEHLTPQGLFNPFETALELGKLHMFSYRFFYTPSQVDESIRKTVPWYDLQFYPEIENPDRFILAIVCRDYDQQIIYDRARSLLNAVHKFIEKIAREIGK